MLGVLFRGVELVSELPLSKLEWTIWELDCRVLAYQAIVKAAEGFVPLLYLPVLAIELDLYQIFSVGPIVRLILYHLSLHNLHLKWYLEEKITLSGAVFCALFHMLDKVFLWEENVAELALHGDWVFKDTLIDLNLGNFLCQMPVSLFDVLDGFR